MNYDMRITAAQLRAAGEWCEPTMADVELRDDYGTLTVEQGDDRISFRADGSEDPTCTHCGMPESVHRSGDREYGHAYEPVPDDEEEEDAEPDPEPEYCPECGMDVNYEGHDSDCPIVQTFVPLSVQRAAAQDDPRGERDR